MTTLTEDKAVYFTAGTLGLLAASYVGAVLLYLLSGLDPDLARPWTAWHFLGDPVFHSRALLSLAIPHLALLGLVAGIYARPQPEFGSARWATRRDIAKADLFSQDGILLGKSGGQYLVSDTPTHIMVIAPTRSGKGVGLVIPNLLNWKGSVICLDVKQENFKKTAGYRKEHGYDVFMWSPLDQNGRSHRYNPLDAVSKDPHQRISDLQVIAKILVKDPVKSDPVWASEARALFIGLALYVMDSPDMPTTIGAINRLLGTEQDLGDVCRHIVENHPELSPTMNKTLMNFANKAAKERSGVKSTLNQAINLWDNPVIDAATSKSDFSIADLRKKKMAVYVGVMTGQIPALAPLLRIFFEQVITTLAMKEPDESEPHKVLLMMDEFHMLGHMSSMTSAFTLLGGYNCRVMAVVQGLKWLDDVYGRDKRDGILSCCAHQIFFAANDLETAAYVSRSCGEKTVTTVSTSRKSAWKYEPPSKSTSQRPRPLISQEAVKQLQKDKSIIITESSFPVQARKIQYFRDKQLKTRLLPPPEVPELQVESKAIPVFNISKPEAQKKATPESKQEPSLFPSPPKTPPRLSEWLEELDDEEEKD
ncbi:MAG: type IV secretory system conjugative DNA transfer family protein [Alphaproteobacteria bacterium]|nr:type IV secretory system conjugative DNA transfer family protein [Alphaproteobacteria bacterium]